MSAAKRGHGKQRAKPKAKKPAKRRAKGKQKNLFATDVLAGHHHEAEILPHIGCRGSTLVRVGAEDGPTFIKVDKLKTALPGLPSPMQLAFVAFEGFDWWYVNLADAVAYAAKELKPKAGTRDAEMIVVLKQAITARLGDGLVRGKIDVVF